MLLRPQQNRFDRMEWAGAFGDLGTLIPFVVAYIAVVKMDPLGVLFAFGTAMIVCGFYYQTPFPVQPMKAAGAVAATQAAQSVLITPASVTAASFVTGVLWLLLSITGATGWLARVVSRSVIIGIVLGLGMAFMLQGIKMMSAQWWVAGFGLFGTLLLLTNRALPAMFLLLLGGALWGLFQQPELGVELLSISLQPRLPSFALAQIGWNDLWVGTVFLALPQIPLTLGNAIFAITEENNRLFPERPVSEQGVAASTGLMNLFSSCVGGVPMCHGAGGMAGHVRFGARSGGAPIILGTILLALALFFSQSVTTLLKLFPDAILGVILFLTGAQLALGSCDFGSKKTERFVTLVTAAFAIWNVGAAFVVGMICQELDRRGLLKL